MHPLHDDVAKQLGGKLKSRRVVVWYDEPGEFQSFVGELRGGPRTVREPVPIPAAVAGEKASLVEYAGSMFELRAVVEPYVSGDTPGLVVIYVPGVARDRGASVLMELEKAGTAWVPRLKQLARNVLLQKYTLGVVDELLPFDRKVSYEDLARAAAGTEGAEPPSILRSIFFDARDDDELLAAWLASDVRDAGIESKEATSELTKLVKARLGVDLVADSPLAKLRAITLRYVLGGEFRLDLSCDAPASLEAVPMPPTRDAESAVRGLARRLRNSHADAYAALADRVEAEFGLRSATLLPGALGSVDTFRFEERALLRYAGDLIVIGRFSEALALVAEREQSFWLDRDVSRKAHWEAARRVAELGSVAAEVRQAVSKFQGDAAAWLGAYVGPGAGSRGRGAGMNPSAQLPALGGWFRLDHAQRRLEAWVANLDEEPDERPLGVVRRAYEDACHAMAEGFNRALVKAGWTVPGALHQTRVWSQVVADQPKPVAYFLVDAMRFEMGVELAERLPKASEVTLRAAVGSLPSITPIGMAALMPGASASFSVVEKGGKLGARIDDNFLPDLATRKRHAAARVPKLVDLTLDDLLTLQPSTLAKKLEGAEVVVVRSQEIDHAGETGSNFQARQVMDMVIANLARAFRKLAVAEVEHAVVSADHGHLFFANDRDESMRIDAPGGNQVELHRRCWSGRGGVTPPGCVRVAGSSLGYASDLDFVFPAATGVFKAGGDLAFHHGGPSLQELVVPVLTVRTKVAESVRSSEGRIGATGLPDAVTNRIFTVRFTYGPTQRQLGATGIQARPLLMAGRKQVGALGMALDAEFDRAAGTVKLEPDKPVTIALLLSDESATSLRVVVQDPTTDAELYRSPGEIPVRLGM